MNKRKQQILSFLVASTVMVSTPIAARAIDDNTEPTEVVDTNAGYTTYTVKKGDTLGKIAERYYGNAAYYVQLAQYNHIEDPTLIFPNQVIIIPRDFSVVYDFDANEATVADEHNYENDTAYTVQWGDSLDIIVLCMYGRNDRCIVDRVATYNGLSDPNKIVVGDVLYFPSLERVLEVNPNDYSAEYAEMAAKFREMARRRRHCRHTDCPVVPYPPVCVPVFPEEECPCRRLTPGC